MTKTKAAKEIAKAKRQSAAAATRMVDPAARAARPRRATPQAQAPKSRKDQISFQQAKRADRTKVNFEFVIGDLTTGMGTGAIHSLGGAVMPGSTRMFGRLAKIAEAYHEYRFDELEFFFDSTVSEFAAAGQDGQVGIACIEDAVDPTPASISIMQEVARTMVCKPAAQRRHYYRFSDELLDHWRFLVQFYSSGFIGDEPQSNFECRVPNDVACGRLVVISEHSGTSGLTIGKIGVRGVVEFRWPWNEILVSTLPSIRWGNMPFNYNTFVTGVDNPIPFGSTRIDGGDGIFWYDNSGVTTLVLLRGNYFVDVIADFASTTTALTFARIAHAVASGSADVRANAAGTDSAARAYLTLGWHGLVRVSNVVALTFDLRMVFASGVGSAVGNVNVRKML